MRSGFDVRPFQWLSIAMSLAQLKDQAAHLPFKEQRELIAFLISLRTEQDENFKAGLAAKIDDKNPANWVELDDLTKRFAN
jgi:hypothetical protein